MTMKHISTVVAVLGLGSLLSGCDVQQPSAGCVVQDSASWIAKYDLKEGQPACAKPLAAGETVGVFKYTDPMQANSTIIALRPNGLASRGSRDPGDQRNQTAVGSLGEQPDENDFCTATELGEATVTAAPKTTAPVEDETRISYKFKDVKVYTNPRAPGTQLKADLTYTRDGCTAEYAVRAMWPAIACDPEDEDPAHNCGPGSFINPDMAVTCDPVLHICVPAKEIPSFKE